MKRFYEKYMAFIWMTLVYLVAGALAYVLYGAFNRLFCQPFGEYVVRRDCCLNEVVQIAANIILFEILVGVVAHYAIKLFIKIENR